MKKRLIVVIIMLLGAVGITAAEEVQVDMEVTWVSKYIWRGFDLLDDKAALQPSINFDLGCGFSANLWTSQPMANGGVDAEEWDYTLAYSNTIREGENCQMDYVLSWVYYDYPDAPTKDTDAQEIGLAVSFPEISSAGWVPRYQVVRHWAAKSGGANNEVGGWWHFLGVGYDFQCPATSAPLNFSWDIAYNGGAGSVAGADHEWSHTVFGLSTDFECPTGGIFTPAIYYQISMDDSVNDEDEFWVGLTYGFSF